MNVEIKKNIPFSTLTGLTLTDVKVISLSPDDDEANTAVEFYVESTKYVMYHDQECSEKVSLIDVCGDWQDVIDTPILEAYESSRTDVPYNDPDLDLEGSLLWTFYRLRTNKGTVTLRWQGQSNGYYSVRVQLDVHIRPYC